MLHPVKLAQQLIQIPTVTPEDNGCQSFISSLLTPHGFHPKDLSSHGVTNTLLTKGSGPLILISAHTDVVPADKGQWRHPPFAGIIEQGLLFGRGACDMKGALAAMICAMTQIAPKKCTIGLALTSDEEGPSRYGSKIIANHLRETHQRPACTLVIEPTSSDSLGDIIKTGRRGSLYLDIHMTPKGHHVAYLPSNKDPILDVIQLLGSLKAHFSDPAIHFHLVKIEGGHANNVTPNHIHMRLNWRHDASLQQDKIKKETEQLLQPFNADLTWTVGAQPYRSPSDHHATTMKNIIQQTLTISPVFTQSGGASDGRFFSEISKEIFEFGPINQTIHQPDEHACIQDIEKLSRIYLSWLEQTDASF